MLRMLTALVLLSGASLAFAQTQESVGDIDSFGRNVVHLGLASIRPLFLMEEEAQCAAFREQGSLCTVLAPQPALTLFEHTDLDTLQLPARVTNSLLCFSLTTSINRQFHNFSGETVIGAQLRTRALVRIESPVFSNPSLTDPNTGEPLNGKIDMPFTTHNEEFSMAGFGIHRESSQQTRSCLGGLVSKRSLMGTYGLTQAQANSFFNNPIKITIGASGSARLVTELNYNFGIRIYGDRR